MFLSLTGIPKSFRQVVGSVVEIILWACLSILVLQTLGFGGIITFFTGSILAIGLVMAAGGSTLASDIVAGLFLSGHPDFNVGDVVIAGEVPTEGTVISMDSRRVRLLDQQGRLHILPNSIVERKEWVLVNRAEAPETPAVHVVRRARRLTSAAATAAAQKASAALEKANLGDNK